MGVIFRAADDVSELLIPFVAAAGGVTDDAIVASAYLDASRGTISPDEFWHRVGVDPLVEDAYLSRHSLVPGVRGFIAAAAGRGIPVWCLSNDVDRWSRKLRGSFEIEQFLAGAVISSAVGARKPDRAIYQCLIDRSGFRPEDLLFVDDRPANVEAAISMSIPSVRFEPAGGYRELQRMFG